MPLTSADSTRSRGTVATMSIINCDNDRRPLAGPGSPVNRNRGASTIVLVTGITVTLTCV